MEEEQMLTKEQILDMLDAGQYKELKEQLESNMYPVDLAEILEDLKKNWEICTPLILPRHWKILSRNRSLWCSVSWQKKRLLRHLLI